MTLLILSAIAYFGANVGEVYFRFFRYRDAMSQEALFASRNSDAVILARLRAVADSLGLPAEAGRVHIRRLPGRVLIGADYTESVELPLRVREFRFSPLVERPQ